MIVRQFRMWVCVAVVAAVVVSAMNRTCSIATADDPAVIATTFESVAGNPVFVSDPGTRLDSERGLRLEIVVHGI